MSAAELQQKIVECEQALALRREEAERALESFFAVVTDAMREWVPTVVKQQVTREHEHTTALGTAGLAMLKSDLARLVDDVPALVRKWFDRDTLWGHRQNFRSNGNTYYPPRVHDLNGRTSHHPTELVDTLRKGIDSTLMPFMTKHGYKLGEVAGRRYFPAYFEWRATWNPTINAYADQYDAFVKAKEALDRAVAAKGHHDANILWDNA